MKNTAMISLVAGYVVLSVAVLVFVFGDHHALSSAGVFNASSAQEQTASVAGSGGPLAYVLTSSMPSLYSIPTDIQSTATSVQTKIPDTYQYKLLDNVDPCTMNTLGRGGWHATQFGSNVLSVGGKDETCSRKGIYEGFDWVLFEKQTSYISPTDSGN